MMEQIRLAVVRYLNTAPLIEGLSKLPSMRVLPAAPSRIAEMVMAGEADLGLASIIDAARHPLSVFQCGMIGCDGPTLTVRLFSAVPLNRITRLHADTDSHTSVALATVLLDRLYGVKPEVIDFDARERVERNVVASGAGRALSSAGASLDEAWPESVLLIGDKVVVDSPPAVRYPHQLDLGEAWKQWTGLPFVYAGWMCKRERAEDPAIHTAAALLDRQRRHNQTRLDHLIARRAPEHRWPTDLARRYVGELLRYDLDERAREGADKFIAEASRLGLCGASGGSGGAKGLRWVETKECAEVV